MMQKTLELWVILKTAFGEKMKWIGNSHCESSFVACTFPKIPSFSDLTAKGFRYESDVNLKYFFLFGIMSFLCIIPVFAVFLLSAFLFLDRQYDSVTVMKKLKADCNSINRLIQMACHVSGLEAYLVTYIAKPFGMSHGTCICKEDGFFWVYDYGIKQIKAPTMKEAVEKVAILYDAKAVCYVCQDVNWNIVKIE